MGFAFDLLVAGVIDAVVLWVATLLVSRLKLSLGEIMLIPFVCRLVMRLIALGVGDIWPRHPRLAAGAAAVIGLSLLAEFLNNVVPNKVEGYSKPQGLLIALVVILADYFASSPLAAWLWGRISP
jgi:hypothetical protein